MKESTQQYNLYVTIGIITRMILSNEFTAVQDIQLKEIREILFIISKNEKITSDHDISGLLNSILC